VKLTDLEDGVAYNPYGMVAGAIGVGFLLGGGLFTRLTGRLVGAGLRLGLMAALPFLKDELLAAANQTINGAGPKATAGESS
jgi:hypothetical protein